MNIANENIPFEKLCLLLLDNPGMEIYNCVITEVPKKFNTEERIERVLQKLGVHHVALNHCHFIASIH